MWAQALLPSLKLPVSIPIHAVILPLQSTLSSGSSSLQNKLAIQAPTCFSKYSPSLHLDLQSAFISQPFVPLMSLLLPHGIFLLCSSFPPRLSFTKCLGGCCSSFWPFPIKTVQVSDIILFSGSFFIPYTSYLTDLIQTVNCLCGCLVISPQSENRRKLVYPEDLYADPAIGFNQSRVDLFSVSSSTAPFLLFKRQWTMPPALQSACHLTWLGHWVFRLQLF